LLARLVLLALQLLVRASHCLASATPPPPLPPPRRPLALPLLHPACRVLSRCASLALRRRTLVLLVLRLSAAKREREAPRKCSTSKWLRRPLLQQRLQPLALLLLPPLPSRPHLPLHRLLPSLSAVEVASRRSWLPPPPRRAAASLCCLRSVRHPVLLRPRPPLRLAKLFQARARRPRPAWFSAISCRPPPQ